MSQTPVLLLLGVIAASSLNAQEVSNTSFSAPDGSRVLQQSLVIPATRAELWAAFTTTEGIRSWAAPVVSADFRLGGIWESSYSLKAKIGDSGNIKNQYLGYVPLHMVAIQAIAAPPSFPSRELLVEIFTVIELDSLAPRQTRVTISMMGYRSGTGFDAIYRHFEGGNAWSLQKLHERFVTGPVEWQKILSAPKQPGALR